jgi:hypothetical protein
MTWRFNQNVHLKGEQQCGSFEITYQMPNGIKSDGTHYHGTTRIAYLPACNQGREVLTMLIEAFRRKMTFIVGTSQTTGQ